MTRDFTGKNEMLLNCKTRLIPGSAISHVTSCVKELCNSCKSLKCDIHLALDSLSGEAPTQFIIEIFFMAYG